MDQNDVFNTASALDNYFHHSSEHFKNFPISSINETKENLCDDLLMKKRFCM